VNLPFSQSLARDCDFEVSFATEGKEKGWTRRLEFGWRRNEVRASDDIEGGRSGGKEDGRCGNVGDTGKFSF